MNRNHDRIQPLRLDLPIYPLGVAAKLLQIHPRTLKNYEKEKLIIPVSHGARTLYSENDLTWTQCLRSIIHEKGISIPGVKKLLHIVPCWEINSCPEATHSICPAMVDRSVSRELRLVGRQAIPHGRESAPKPDSGRKTMIF